MASTATTKMTTTAPAATPRASRPPAAALDRVDRAALARAALARAEELTGARSVMVVPVAGEAQGTGHAVSAAPAVSAASAIDADPAKGAALPLRPGVMADLERPPLPVLPALTSVFPDGLRRGSTVAVQGSTSLVLALLSGASAAGRWAAVVGQPAVGLLAAAQSGVVLDRLALVPQPGPDAPAVIAALLDGVDVVLAGPRAALTDADRRRLTARARERGSLLVATTRWPGAAVVVEATDSVWSGLGAGEGRLRTHRLRVRRSGRGAAGRPQTIELNFPLGESGQSGVVEVTAPAQTRLTSSSGTPPSARGAGEGAGQAGERLRLVG